MKKVMEILRNRIAVGPIQGKLSLVKGFYSVRLSGQGRVVYSIGDDKLVVYIIGAKTHYGD
ncbi:hypothetical protein P4B35_10225 [Pontiellaceae bacterium B12227]|nr:hypothetical protein [Pontiellaceae bacterium B12227]